MKRYVHIKRADWDWSVWDAVSREYVLKGVWSRRSARKAARLLNRRLRSIDSMLDRGDPA